MLNIDKNASEKHILVSGWVDFKIIIGMKLHFFLHSIILCLIIYLNWGIKTVVILC